MVKKLRILGIVFVTALCFSLGEMKITNSIPGFSETTVSAKTFLYKYGKVWMWTSKVQSLGKKRMHKTRSKKKVKTYRVYISKGDIKARNASGLTLIGGVSAGKAGAIISSLVGINFNSPKHGYRYDVQMINSKITLSWNYHRWH